MARKAGPLVLIAFLIAIVVAGRGGVTSPWLPRFPQSPPEPVTVAQARVAAGASWQVHRME